MWTTGSLYLKHFLVSRGQLYSPTWGGHQLPGTSRCSRLVLSRVKEFQGRNQGWN